MMTFTLIRLNTTFFKFWLNLALIFWWICRFSFYPYTCTIFDCNQFPKFKNSTMCHLNLSFSKNSYYVPNLQYFTIPICSIQYLHIACRSYCAGVVPFNECKVVTTWLYTSNWFAPAFLLESMLFIVCDSMESSANCFVNSAVNADCSFSSFIYFKSCRKYAISFNCIQLTMMLLLLFITMSIRIMKRNMILVFFAKVAKNTSIGPTMCSCK